MDITVKKESGFVTRKRRDLIFYSVFIALPVLQFLIFYLAVNLNSFKMALQEYNMDTGEYSWIGLENFAKIFTNFKMDVMYTTALKNSIVAQAWSLFVGVPCALLFSYYLYKKMLGHGFFRVMLFLPSILSSVVMVVVFRYFLDDFLTNVLNKLFGLSLRPIFSNPSLTFGLLIFYNIWLSFGTSTLLYSSAMSGIDVSIVESCHLEGAGPLQEFIYITFPLIYSTVIVFLITSIAAIFTNQLNLYSFFQERAEYALYTLGYYLYKNVVHATGEMDYPYLAAFGLLFSFIAIPITLLLKWVLNKVDPTR